LHLRFASSICDLQDRFFALDSRAEFRHSEITSQTSSAAGFVKLLFACQP
jgi:hypothetical protein